MPAIVRMMSFSRQVDQWIMIGSDIRVAPTDIDPAGVRLIARGRLLGGPQDGATFDTAFELIVGQSCHLGPHVCVNVIEVKGECVRLGILAPANVPVFRKEEVDQLRGGQGSHGQ